MESLEKARWASAKAMMENEGLIQSQEAEIKKLREEIAKLERSDPLEEHDLDSVVLRAQMLKGLGFDTVQDAAGYVQKVIICEFLWPIYRERY